MPRVEKTQRRSPHDKVMIEKVTLLDRDFDAHEEEELAYRRWRERIDQQLGREA